MATCSACTKSCPRGSGPNDPGAACVVAGATDPRGPGYRPIAGMPHRSPVLIVLASSQGRSAGSRPRIAAVLCHVVNLPASG